MAAGSDEEFLNDRGGVEFGEGRDVETVIVEKELENVVALLTGEAEEVHGSVVHSHELQQIGSLLSLHIVGMEGLIGDERGIAQVEEVALVIVVEVGEEADELSQMDHEDEMEVGHGLECCIEPLHGGLDEGEECAVLLFAAGDIIEKFGEEECRRQLIGVERYRQVGYCNPDVANALQVGLWPLVELDVEQCHGLIELLLIAPACRLWHGDDAAESAYLLGQQVDNHPTVTVFNCPQYDRFCLDKHVFIPFLTTKLRKIMDNAKISSRKFGGKRKNH